MSYRRIQDSNSHTHNVHYQPPTYRATDYWLYTCSFERPSLLGLYVYMYVWSIIPKMCLNNWPRNYMYSTPAGQANSLPWAIPRHLVLSLVPSSMLARGSHESCCSICSCAVELETWSCALSLNKELWKKKRISNKGIRRRRERGRYSERERKR